MPQSLQTRRVVPSNRDGVDRADRRWLAAWFGVFCAGIVLLAGVHRVYRLTGPHPQVRQLIRQLKHTSRWFIPGMKGPRQRSMLPGSAPVLEPTGAARYAGSARASGHEAQRART
jgi:hypothetical protein